MENQFGTSDRLVLRAFAIAFFSLAFGTTDARSQEITGTPGSPTATTTIDGTQLPPPDPAFGGVIKEKASEFDALVAAAHRAPEGRTERAAHHDR